MQKLFPTRRQCMLLRMRLSLRLSLCLLSRVLRVLLR
jgi:hypothetical protein